MSSARAELAEIQQTAALFMHPDDVL